MGLFDLIANTVEGAAEVAANAAKALASPALLPFDADALDDAADGIEKGVKKIGKTDDQ